VGSGDDNLAPARFSLLPKMQQLYGAVLSVLHPLDKNGMAHGNVLIPFELCMKSQPIEFQAPNGGSY